MEKILTTLRKLGHEFRALDPATRVALIHLMIALVKLAGSLLI